MTSAEGLARVFNRGKVDVMSMLPEEDVANMRDVEEVMTPGEILEWQLKRLSGSYIMNSKIYAYESPQLCDHSLLGFEI